MADDQQTEERDDEKQSAEGGDESSGEESSAKSRAQDAQDSWERARETVKKLEESDEPPTDLREWPADEAKYVTFGGGEGDHGYDEGPERKLGPSSLERHEDGSVTIEGEKVDNPDDYKAEPIGGAAETTTWDRMEEGELGEDAQGNMSEDGDRESGEDESEGEDEKG